MVRPLWLRRWILCRLFGFWVFTVLRWSFLVFCWWLEKGLGDCAGLGCWTHRSFHMPFRGSLPGRKAHCLWHYEAASDSPPQTNFSWFFRTTHLLSHFCRTSPKSNQNGWAACLVQNAGKNYAKSGSSWGWSLAKHHFRCNAGSASEQSKTNRRFVWQCYQNLYFPSCFAWS